jgi:hemin uptake protein HemP
MHDGDPLVTPAVAPGTTAPLGTLPREASRSILPCKRLSSDALLAGMNEIEIEHGASIYRLRITSLGKLILTK